MRGLMLAIGNFFWTHNDEIIVLSKYVGAMQVE